jgi:hypothetical protein
VGFDDVDAFATETSVGWIPQSADRRWAAGERWTGASFTV